MLNDLQYCVASNIANIMWPIGGINPNKGKVIILKNALESEPQ